MRAYVVSIHLNVLSVCEEHLKGIHGVDGIAGKEGAPNRCYSLYDTQWSHNIFILSAHSENQSDDLNILVFLKDQLQIYAGKTEKQYSDTKDTDI